jgi:hypothetical protein
MRRSQQPAIEDAIRVPGPGMGTKNNNMPPDVGGRCDCAALASRTFRAGEGMINLRVVSEAEKELPDTACGPQLWPSESASAPRRAFVVLRTPMYPARIEKISKVAIYGSWVLYPQLLNCTQRLVGGLGAWGDVSYPLVYSHLESGLGEILASAQFWPRNQVVLLSDFASPSSSPIFIAALVASTLSKHSRFAYWRWIERQPEPNLVLLSLRHHLFKSWLSGAPRHRAGLVLSRCFPNLQI